MEPAPHGRLRPAELGRDAAATGPVDRGLASGPTTSALARMRGKVDAGPSKCVTPQAGQTARRARTCSKPLEVRTTRRDPKPHGRSRPPQPGQAALPAASSAPTLSWPSVTTSTAHSSKRVCDLRAPARRAGGANSCWGSLPTATGRSTTTTAGSSCRVSPKTYFVFIQRGAQHLRPQGPLKPPAPQPAHSLLGRHSTRAAPIAVRAGK